MNKVEIFGFLISIIISVYLYREVRELKEKIISKETDTVKQKQKTSNVIGGKKKAKPKAKFAAKSSGLPGLTMIDAVKVGHVQFVDVGNGKTLKLITRAVKPHIFEIPNFMDDNEMKFFMDEAISQNMFSSQSKSGLSYGEADYVKNEGKGKAKDPIGIFTFWDTNGDGAIDMTEAKKAISTYDFFLRPEQDDINQMFSKINETVFEDGLITEEEWNELDTIMIENQFNFWKHEDPRFRSRYSDQTWMFWQLDTSGIMNNIRERVTKLTKLPREIVYGGEPMQVAHYNPRGHFHAHWDSESHLLSDIPCCHQHSAGVADDTGRCRLCRFITIMTYMNDAEEGGETAFLHADNQTYNPAAERSKENLSSRCQDANLAIKPKKGTAVFWYDHKIDPESNWLGELDSYSLHGGCDVIKGEKWINNIWLTAPYKDKTHIPSVYLANDFKEKWWLKKK